MAIEAVAGSVNELGQDVFIKLLTTELKYQDPLKPLDSTEFITQLSQFSALDQMRGVNMTVGGIAQSMTSLNNLGMAGLIGKEVQVVGATATLSDPTQPVTLTYHIDQAVRSIQVTIYNSAGDTVRILEEGGQVAGFGNVSWDGQDDHGNALPLGEYTFSVKAAGVDGRIVKSTPYMYGRVTGVSYEGGVPSLIVNGGSVPASGVREVRSGS